MSEFDDFLDEMADKFQSSAGVEEFQELIEDRDWIMSSFGNEMELLTNSQLSLLVMGISSDEDLTMLLITLIKATFISAIQQYRTWLLNDRNLDIRELEGRIK